jgi:carbon storage regulator
MLLLSRKLGERIHIGGGIELEVVAVQGSRVKLGISCPRDIPILRAELSRSAACPTMSGEPTGTLQGVAG